MYAWFVLALVLNSKNKFIIATLTMWGVVHDEWVNYLRVYRCLLTNHLHDKAAEKCLANQLKQQCNNYKIHRVHQ